MAEEKRPRPRIARQNPLDLIDKADIKEGLLTHFTREEPFFMGYIQKDLFDLYFLLKELEIDMYDFLKELNDRKERKYGRTASGVQQG